MKCIQAIKETKNTKVGEIKRIEDKEAQQRVDGGYWKYVSKSEWKKTKSNVVETIEIGHDMGGSYEVKTNKKIKTKNFTK